MRDAETTRKGGGGSKLRSTKGRVTRDVIYEWPQTLCETVRLQKLLFSFLRKKIPQIQDFFARASALAGYQQLCLVRRVVFIETSLLFDIRNVNFGLWGKGLSKILRCA